ncbi:MAG: lytic transglycosylase domain-containing protein [Albidovulum sp.]|uniref:lytic transglycosylase domain-containing protein n=1 Tax=Albidovulum sp. TaxID=1872424 RepID=UPI003CB64483
MRKTALALALTSAASAALAQGVPVVDAKGIAKGAAVLGEKKALTAAEQAENAKRANITTIRQDQLDAIDSVLSTVTGASAATGSIETLASAQATNVYAIDDNNPYADRLFGDARVTIEQMIIATAQKYGGHPALAKAGINPMEFRCWFQALVKQESNFSIGARSPKAAYGLTQIIPGTAQGLGIYPAYYDDPYLQLDGGARYLLQQLSKFGSMPLALAAYNAGPGAVQKYGGIPPYQETQDYVVKITGYYNRYAARVSGVDTEGTFDPRDMVIAEASNQADAGLHYGVHASTQITQSLTRLREIATRVPATASAKEAMDLNAYARVEAARIAWMVQRLKAARAQVEHARYALLLQAYAQDQTFLQVRFNP